MKHLTPYNISEANNDQACIKDIINIAADDPLLSLEDIEYITIEFLKY